MGIANLKTRQHRLRLSTAELATLAGVHEVTLNRIFRRGSANTGSLDKLAEALAAEEIALARHLLALPHVENAIAAAGMRDPDSGGRPEVGALPLPPAAASSVGCAAPSVGFADISPASRERNNGVLAA